MLKLNMLLLSESGDLIKIDRVMKRGYVGSGRKEDGSLVSLSMFEVERNHYRILSEDEAKEIRKNF